MSPRIGRILIFTGWLGAPLALAAPAGGGHGLSGAAATGPGAAVLFAAVLGLGLPLLIVCGASSAGERWLGWSAGRSRSQTSLRLSEEKFRLHYRNNPIPIYTWRHVDGDFELIDFNVAADKLTRGAIHRLLGARASELYRQRPEIRGELEGCYRSRQPIQREMEYDFVSTGERKWFAVQYVFVPPDLVMVHTEDISRQKQAESALRVSETRYRHLFEGLNDAALVIDAESGCILDTNREGERLLGRPRDEIIGRHHTDFQPPRDAPHHRRLFEELARQHHAARLDSEVQQPDGTRFSVTVSASILMLGGQRLVLCLLRDSRIQRATEDLLRVQRALALTLSAVDDLGTVLAHVVQAACRIEGIDAAAVYLHDMQTGSYEQVRSANLSAGFMARTRHFTAETPEAQLIRDGQSVHLSRAQIDAQLPYLRNEGLRSVFILPVHFGGRLVAALDVASRRMDEIPPLSREAVEGIAAGIGGVIARVRAQAALKESEQKFRTLAETAPAGILIVVRNEVRYVNPAMAAMLDYAPADMIGQPIERFVHPDMRERILERVLVRQGGGDVPGRYEVHLLDRGGRSRWFDLSASRIDFEGESASLGTLVDITDRRAAEAALRESEERHRILAQHATDFISRVSPDGVWWDVSLACRKLLGFEPSELIGLSGFTILHPDDVAAARAFHERILSTTHAQQQELRLRRKDGRYSWFETNAQAIRSPHAQRVVEIVAVSRDISERKAAEEASRRHREHLAHVARVSTMGEMASALAHELAQPLSAILYYARSSVTRLRSRAWGISEATQGMQKIAEQADRAGEFIHRLKRFVRKAETTRATISLHDVVRESLGIVEAETRHKQVTIHCELADDLPPVTVDPIQIEQVVLNLVRNGIDALENLPLGQRVIHLRTARCEDGRVSLSVEDQGCGIRVSNIETLFEYFYTTKDRGMGMGLPISRSIIEAHDGELWARPRDGGGAVFGFTLPAAEALNDGQA